MPVFWRDFQYPNRKSKYVRDVRWSKTIILIQCDFFYDYYLARACFLSRRPVNCAWKSLGTWCRDATRHLGHIARGHRFVSSVNSTP